jgi:thiol-disulfide isomerase/thioredoxin
MRKAILFLVLATLTTAASADEKPNDKKPKGPSLKAGDPAPALTVSKWLQGAEVSRFVPGKVYVVEFWATWCGPCITMMPHLGEVQAEYRDKGVTVIGFTSVDERGNTAQRVAQFVAKRGPKLGYTFAFEDGDKSNAAWLEAAGQNGIPCSFVVDQKGNIAYIGHPMFLGEVLPQVVAGTWDAKTGAAKLEEIEKDVDATFEKLNEGDTATKLKALKEFEARRPGLANLPFFVAPRIMFLIGTKHYDEAAKAAATAVAKAVELGDTAGLRTVVKVLQSPDAKGQKGLSELSLKSADELVKMAGDKDYVALLTAAEAYLAAGDKAKARDLGKKAITAAADEPADTRKEIEEITKRYEEKK